MSDIIDEELVDNFYADVIEEDAGDGKKKIAFKSILSEADKLNQNHRVYSRDVLKEVYEEAKKRSEESGQPIFGELEHAKDAKINLERIACTFPEFTWNEELGRIEGKAVPTLTEAGKTVEGLAKSGWKIMFSTRMSGKVKPMTEERKRQLNITEDCVEVCPGARLISVDIVGNPSCKSAVSETVYEEKQEEEVKHNPTFKTIFDSLIK